MSPTSLPRKPDFTLVSGPTTASARTLADLGLEAAARSLIRPGMHVLNLVSGMSLISVSPQAWAIIENNPAAPRASLLSLLD